MASLIYVGAAVLGAASSYQSGRENRKFQQKQQQIQSRVDKLNARKSKVQAYREKALAEAEQVQTAANTGSGAGLGGSSFAGGISSLETQYGANAQYVSMINGYQEASNGLENKAGQYQSLSQLFGAVGSVAGDNFGGKAGANNTMRNMFKKR